MIWPIAIIIYMKLGLVYNNIMPQDICKKFSTQKLNIATDVLNYYGHHYYNHSLLAHSYVCTADLLVFIDYCMEDPCILAV